MLLEFSVCYMSSRYEGFQTSSALNLHYVSYRNVSADSKSQIEKWTLFWTAQKRTRVLVVSFLCWLVAFSIGSSFSYKIIRAIAFLSSLRSKNRQKHYFRRAIYIY